MSSKRSVSLTSTQQHQKQSYTDHLHSTPKTVAILEIATPKLQLQTKTDLEFGDPRSRDLPRNSVDQAAQVAKSD